MSRFLFALTDAGGTVPPELGAVRRVVERGHHVTVLGDASMAEQAARTGADWRPWSIPAEPVRDWEARSPLEMARMTVHQMIAGPAPGHAADTTAAIEELEPEVVVASMVSVGAMVAAEGRRLPLAVLIPNIYPMPAPGLPPFGMGLAPARGPLGRVRDRVVTAASTRLLGRYALGPLNAVRHQYGLPPVRTPWGQHERAARQLILTAAAFDFPGSLPPNARYVGPVLDDPSWAERSPGWEPPTGSEPLVVVAFSSTFQDHVDCLQRVTDALDGVGVRGLVTTGPAVDPAVIRSGPRVDVVRSVPHSHVFPNADLVITHGGHGTVMKALAADVPMVVMHHGRDQADNAVRLTTRGAAVAIARGASSKRIAQAVRDVLDDPSYSDAAARLGAAVRAEASTDALETELEGLAQPGR